MRVRLGFFVAALVFCAALSFGQFDPLLGRLTIKAKSTIDSVLTWNSGTSTLSLPSNSILSVLGASGHIDVGGNGITVGGGVGASGFTASNSVSANRYVTTTNCTSAASPAVCTTANAGSVTVAASTSTKVVNTTAVTANSQILLTTDSSLGTKLSVTCNTTNTFFHSVSARVAGTSFTITLDTPPATDPLCLSFVIVN